MRKTAIVPILAMALAAPLTANTYTVTSTADSGVGTLRQAILDANTNPGADTIAFNIVGSGVHTIAVASALPTITGPTTVDGYTQPGSSANTNPTSMGLNTVLQIEIDCSAVGATNCLKVAADDVTIKGLVLEGCFLGTDPSGTQIPAPFHGSLRFNQNHTNGRVGGTTPAARNLIGVDNGAGLLLAVGPPGFIDGLVAGNLIGTDVSGKHPIGLGGAKGINILGGTNTVIGGTSTDARNVINGGINVGSGTPPTGATGNFIRGNYIGIDVTGTITFTCHNECIRLNDNANTVGGSAPGAGNRIGGSDSSGIFVQQSSSGSVIQGNFIGTDETGTVRIPNPTYGIRVYQATGGVTIGGINPGEGNVISNSGTAGVGVEISGLATIRGNSIFDNASANPTYGLGIDLLEGTVPGVTFNDAGDADTGSNGLQNYPFITSVVYGASTTTVNGTLSSAPSTIYDVDFYGNPLCQRRPQDLTEARTFLGTQPVTTDGSGNASFSVVLPVAVANGSLLTATATDPAGNTSELSPRFAIVSTPAYGNQNATNITVTGLAFEDGATVTVGGIAATNVVVTDSHTLTATTPHLTPGSANAIVVSNPGGASGAIPNGFLANFADVPDNDQFHLYVMRLVGNGITAGVGGGLYGIGQSTKRQQMAVFLLKAEHGACFTPPPCTGVFPDVPCPSTFAAWIETLAAEGITGGCGGGNFCPDNPVRRDQMAVFLLKAEHGPYWGPPACHGQFPDVACPSPFADWIEQLAAEGVTGGCGGGNYCPLNSVTRGQMAAFLVKAFTLP
jgi:S-layer homology domain